MSAIPINPPLPEHVKRLLVVGGTFDPPHRAHVRLALAAAEASGCEHVLFVPAWLSPLKEESPTAAAHRLAMLRLALAGEPRASVSTFEIDRGGTSFTIETLTALRAALSDEIELRLFMGSDQLRSLDQWREAERVVELARPVVVLRPPDTHESLRAAGVPEQHLNWIVDVPVEAASSTQVRAMLARGQDASGLIEPRVLEYIRAHDLYQERKITGTGTFILEASGARPGGVGAEKQGVTNVPVPFISEPVERLLARLAAAGVAEPSTLVIECAREPGRVGPTPRTAMSSRVAVPTIIGAAFHPTGLAEGYCTYAIEWREAEAMPDTSVPPADLSPPLSEFEQLALGLRAAVLRVRSQGVPVRRFVLTGFTEASGLIDRDFAQAIADVLDTRVSVRPCRNVEEQGADILRRLEHERSRYPSISQAIKALADVDGREERVWRRRERARQIARIFTADRTGPS